MIGEPSQRPWLAPGKDAPIWNYTRKARRCPDKVWSEEKQQLALNNLVLHCDQCTGTTCISPTEHASKDAQQRRTTLPTNSREDSSCSNLQSMWLPQLLELHQQGEGASHRALSGMGSRLGLGESQTVPQCHQRHRAGVTENTA